MSLTLEEVNRKLLHGLAVGLPAGIFYGPDLLGLPVWSPAPIIGSLFLFSLAVEFLRFRNSSFGGLFDRCFGSMLRQEESSSLTGATYVFGGSFLCSLLALNGPLAATASFLALSLFILGDAAAALVGKAFGRTRIGDKTLEGALGCFGLCLILSGFVFPVLPDFSASWGDLPWSHAIFLSAMVAALELFPVRMGRLVLIDNLYVPVVVALAALAIHNA